MNPLLASIDHWMGRVFWGLAVIIVLLLLNALLTWTTRDRHVDHDEGLRWDVHDLCTSLMAWDGKTTIEEYWKAYTTTSQGELCQIGDLVERIKSKVHV